MSSLASSLSQSVILLKMADINSSTVDQAPTGPLVILTENFSMSKNDIGVDDRLCSMMALTHAIQNRIIQSSQKGSMSPDVAREIKSHCDSMAQMAHAVSMIK